MIQTSWRTLLMETPPNSYILYEFVIERTHYAHPRHIGTNTSLLNIAGKYKRHYLRRHFIGLHPHTEMSGFISCCGCLQRKRVRRLQPCENVMWINLIGLLSGVIAVCGPWEHSGKRCSPLSALQSPSASGSAGNY